MSNETLMNQLRRTTAAVLCASAMLVAAGSAQAQSEVYLGLSMLPVASVVGTASVAGAAASAVVAVPAALLVSGAVLTVKAVEVSARGTVFVLERASDGAVASVELGAAAAGSVALGVGASVVTTVTPVAKCPSALRRSRTSITCRPWPRPRRSRACWTLRQTSSWRSRAGR